MLVIAVSGVGVRGVDRGGARGVAEHQHVRGGRHGRHVGVIHGAVHVERQVVLCCVVREEHLTTECRDPLSSDCSVRRCKDGLAIRVLHRDGERVRPVRIHFAWRDDFHARAAEVELASRLGAGRWLRGGLVDVQACRSQHDPARLPTVISEKSSAQLEASGVASMRESLAVAYLRMCGHVSATKHMQAWAAPHLRKRSL